MHHEHNAHSLDYHIPGTLVLVIGAALLVAYIAAARATGRRLKRWPVARSICWALGLTSLAASLIGPVAKEAHHQFTAHMTVHLLLGMIGPLFIAFSRPVTLLLRTLGTSFARRLTRLLKSHYMQIISHPVMAALLNIGGLWVLYTTDLYAAMHESRFLYTLIHIHVFLAGYLFTASILANEPAPHRYRLPLRVIVLILEAAAHNILSKHLYAHPPVGVPLAQAETGSMLMYYGGDAVDIMMMTALGYQWFRSVSRESPGGNLKPAA
ncbi:cytochrome c oxidase assembly protein [Paenibacillus cisolokensis]|uniref:cytochrome c oxidase assembly protein n=1 Tax=Paenibacillus cisolokensis TaxID=1658519 RepID=UPI003D2C2FEA